MMENMIILVAAVLLGLGIRQVWFSGFKKRDEELKKIALEYGLAFKTESTDGTISNEISANYPSYLQPHILNELRGTINNHSVLVSDFLEGTSRGKFRMTHALIDGQSKKLQDSMLFDSLLVSVDKLCGILEQLKTS